MIKKEIVYLKETFQIDDIWWNEKMIETYDDGK